MTTVAAWVRDGVGTIAADSRASDDNGVLMFNTPKLHRLNGSVFGVAGDDWVDVFMEWQRTGRKAKPEPIITLHADDVDFNVIELAPDGIWFWNRTFTRIKVKDHEFAIGSGEMVALYIMRCCRQGPQAAVEAASMVDKFTGGDIDVEHVPQKRRRVVKSR